MAAFEKKECPHCKEMVSSHPRWWKEHMAKHEVKEEIKEEKKEVTAETKPEVAPKKAESKKELLDQVRSQEEREMLERALAKQEENAVAPNISAITGSADENMELRKIYAPETIEEYDEKGRVTKPAERHAFIADGKNLRMYVDRGYVPVLNGQGEFVRTPNGDVLTTLDNKTHDAVNEAIEKENLKRERTKAAAVKRAAMESGDKGGDVKGDMVGDGVSLSVDVEQEEVHWKQ